MRHIHIGGGKISSELKGDRKHSSSTCLSLRGKSLFSIHVLNYSLQMESKAGPQTSSSLCQELIQRSWKSNAHWFSPHPFLILPSGCTQEHQQRSDLMMATIFFLILIVSLRHDFSKIKHNKIKLSPSHWSWTGKPTEGSVKEKEQESETHLFTHSIVP